MKTGTSKYSKSANVGMSDYRRKIRDLAKNNGDNPGALNLLIVGKRLGGAKMYRFLYKQSEYLKQFAKVAVTLVDAHEPVALGNEGKKGKWYDYVYFTGGKYHLKWWNDKWGPDENQSKGNAKLRFYNIYQRNKWPRGYGMRKALKNVSLYKKKVYSLKEKKNEKADHWNIAWCDKTVNILADAIAYLKG